MAQYRVKEVDLRNSKRRPTEHFNACQVRVTNAYTTPHTHTLIDYNYNIRIPNLIGYTILHMQYIVAL